MFRAPFVQFRTMKMGATNEVTKQFAFLRNFFQIISGKALTE